MKILHLFIVLFVLLITDGCVDRVGLHPPKSKVITPQAVKVAMILPERIIGRYAHTTSTAVFAYFIRRNEPFTLKTYTIEDESEEALVKVIQEIKKENIHFVIAPLTLDGATTLSHIEDDINVFFPTIHQTDLKTHTDNFYFGAIDYQAQIDAIMPLSSDPLVIMYDKSKQGLKLYKEVEKSYHYEEKKPKKLYSFSINKKRTNLKSYLSNNKKIHNASFFLNTPIIKSTMALSQLSTYDINARYVLSTQINYDPLIFSMTQEKDRKNLYITNSITEYDDQLIQANAILSNDIVYNWINYTSSVGADLFFHLITGKKRLYNLELKAQQVIYPITIVTPKGSHFETVTLR